MHDVVRKFMRIPHDKGSAMREPRDGLGMRFGFNVEHVVKLFWKGLRHTSRLFAHHAHCVWNIGKVSIDMGDAFSLLLDCGM